LVNVGRLLHLGRGRGGEVLFNLDRGLPRRLRHGRRGRGRQFVNPGFRLGVGRSLLLYWRRGRNWSRRQRGFRRRNRLDRRLRNGLRSRARWRSRLNGSGYLLRAFRGGGRRWLLPIRSSGNAWRSFVFDQSRFMYSGSLFLLWVIHLADFGRDIIVERVRGHTHVNAHTSGVLENFFALEF